MGNEQMEEAKSETIRPTKKQQELLDFLRSFIAEHGYGPSYREVMVGCNYTSVATVAVHVQNLIARGHLRKNGRSARSLEIIGEDIKKQPTLQTNAIKPADEKWLTEKVDYIFKQIEESTEITQTNLENLKTLVDALKVLGLESVALSFNSRLTDIKKRIM